MAIKNGYKDSNGTYVGRRKYGLSRGFDVTFSDLGNPYTEKQYGREKCIEMFRQELWKQIKAGEGKMYTAILKLLAIRKAKGSELDLVCWCAPKACHAEVINNCLEWMIQSK